MENELTPSPPLRHSGYNPLFFGVHLSRLVVADQVTQIEEMLLIGGTLGQLDLPPFGDEAGGIQEPSPEKPENPILCLGYPAGHGIHTGKLK
jgi:hypothetical protein